MSLARFLRRLAWTVGRTPSQVDIVVLVLIGIVIGFLGDTLTPGRVPFGWLLGPILGIVGAAVGGYVFGNVAFSNITVGSLAIIPAIIGAIVLVLVVELIIALLTRKRGEGD